jgi:hypothetical protein
MSNLTLTMCLSAVLSTAAADAQVLSQEVQEGPRAATSSLPVAYVYIANTPNGSSTNEIVAYTAAANGSLSAVNGSPFRDNVSSMAVNGKYLMAATVATSAIDAFRIESDGALSYAASTDYQKYNDPGYLCGIAGQIFFDHTGATLYLTEFEGTSACANDMYASFEVVKATGRLTYLGLADTGAFPGAYTAAYFIGDDLYSYSADDSACMYYGIFGFKRSSNGLLTDLGNVEKNLPTPPPGVSAFVPNLAVADPANHLAVAMQPANPPGCAPGPLQLATYTADSSGNLTTTNTYANMPATSIASIYDMKMAPSGKLVAVAGQQGLQIFHFNGASPITHYSGLLTSDPINQMFWDNNNHLYAISQASGKLFVYTITPTGHQAAPGSPHTIASPDDIIVQPLPVY